MEKETLHALGDPGAEIGHFRDSNKKEREITGREGTHLVFSVSSGWFHPTAKLGSESTKDNIGGHG
jgi:hypothetical protein